MRHRAGFLLVALVYKYHWEPAYGAYPLRQDLVLVCTALWAFRLSGYITWRNWGLGEGTFHPFARSLVRVHRGVPLTGRECRLSLPGIPTILWPVLLVDLAVPDLHLARSTCRKSDREHERVHVRATSSDSLVGRCRLWRQVLCAIISQSIYAAIRLPSPPHLNLLDLAASGVWLVGFGFEAIADLQLARFKANAKNRGRLLTSGLFAYTRHPNYFGNATMFAAYYLFALNTDGGWATWYAPALMTFLLTKVSGVALLEKGLAKSKPGFEDYVKGTSAFIPWFPAAKAAASRPAKTN